MTANTLIPESDTISRVQSRDALHVAPNANRLGVYDPVDPVAPTKDKSNGESVLDSISPHRLVAIESLTLSQLFRDLIELTKPRIVVMILVTTLATAFIGAGKPVNLFDLFWLLLGTGLIAASAGAANQIWERDIDRKMPRTASRPVSIGRLSWLHASLFTAVIGVVGCFVIFARFHLEPTLVGLATWLLYVLVYTPMKTRTSWNTTVGAFAGALPMLIGFTATGGALTDVTGWLLVGILVAWQYPHFMAIAWMYRKQYSAAGFRMSTTVDPTGRSAGLQSVLGSIFLVLCAVGLCWMRSSLAGSLFSTLAVLIFCWPILKASVQFKRDPNDQIARVMLRKSLLVLPLVLGVVTLTLLW